MRRFLRLIMPGFSLATMLVAVVVLLAAQSAQALDMAFCSNLNTGAETKPFTYGFQSNGACFEHCKQSYALAVVQGDTCWCSDYVPGLTTSTGDCDQKCPGYGFESCGSTAKDLYGYIALSKAPSGTQGAPSSTLAPTSTETEATNSATPTTSTSEPESTSTPPETTPSPTPSTPSSSSTSASSSSSSTPSTTSTPTTFETSTWSPTPVTSVLTVTGELRTVTITPTGPPRATSALERGDARQGFWSQTGRVVGLFMGLALLIILTMFAVFMWHRRRYRVQPAPSFHIRTSDPTPPGSRSLSEFGLLHDNRTTLVEKDQPVHWEHGATPTVEKRNSRGRVIDQRLDPRAIWSSEMDNSSRASIPSLRDDQDYSRRILRLANPDTSAV